MKTIPPNIKSEISLSLCCNATLFTIPATFGDPSFTLCSVCLTDCKYKWYPVWEKTGPGAYKRIDYIENKK